MLSTFKQFSLKRTFAAVAVLIVSTGAQVGVSALDIVDRAKAAGSFQTLLTAAEAAGLVDALKGPGPYTVFAPSEAAFAKLPDGTIKNLLKPENTKSLAYIISYHVVEGRLTSFDIPTTRIDVPTLNGAKLSLISNGSAATVDAANLTQVDILADNGIIHVVDKVLLPGIFRAPSTPTFSKSPVQVDDATVAKVETKPEPVMVKPEPTAKAITTTKPAVQPESQRGLEPFKYDLAKQIREERKAQRQRVKRPLTGKNLIETATEAGQFQTLLLALQLARMDTGVAKYQNYTVFAPTDRAFEQLPRATRSFLLNPRNRKKLINILANHIVEGNITSDRIRNGRSRLNTINPRYALRIQNSNGQITVNDALVTQADIRANNGVIHVIDRVLLTSPRLLRR